MHSTVACLIIWLFPYSTLYHALKIASKYKISNSYSVFFELFILPVLYVLLCKKCIILIHFYLLLIPFSPCTQQFLIHFYSSPSAIVQLLSNDFIFSLFISADTIFLIISCTLLGKSRFLCSKFLHT